MDLFTCCSTGACRTHQTEPFRTERSSPFDAQLFAWFRELNYSVARWQHPPVCPMKLTSKQPVTHCILAFLVTNNWNKANIRVDLVSGHHCTFEKPLFLSLSLTAYRSAFFALQNSILKFLLGERDDITYISLECPTSKFPICPCVPMYICKIPRAVWSFLCSRALSEFPCGSR